MRLNTAVIYGSARRARQGIKAARFILRKLEDRGHEVTLVDTNEYELPLLDRMYKEYDPGTAPAAMRAVAEILSAADGFVIMSGEYNHSIPPALKNLLDHYQSEYHYKPSAVVTYSAGPFAGVRGLVNIRGILAELGTPAIPSAFPISQVWKAFDDDGTAVDAAYDERIVKFLDEYEWYARALKHERECSACVDDVPTQQQLCRG
ncbi:MAG: NAD(P)H-dependent oxidoreductase [Gammaproteobacteria bacterium]|nr:NAD(P)H-dependent oxidoreductase [Gammaproteobacteria bacterium]